MPGLWILDLPIAAVAAMVIAGAGPAGVERAVGALGSAVAGLGFGVTGATLARSNPD